MDEMKRIEEKSLSREVDAVMARLMELEYENSRLQRLVSELLMKNQQLRGAVWAG